MIKYLSPRSKKELEKTIKNLSIIELVSLIKFDLGVNNIIAEKILNKKLFTLGIEHFKIEHFIRDNAKPHEYTLSCYIESKNIYNLITVLNNEGFKLLTIEYYAADTQLLIIKFK